MNLRLLAVRRIVLGIGAVLTIWGLLDGGFADVLHKAMLICYECMGIG